MANIPDSSPVTACRNAIQHYDKELAGARERMMQLKDQLRSLSITENEIVRRRSEWSAALDELEAARRRNA